MKALKNLFFNFLTIFLISSVSQTTFARPDSFAPIVNSEKTKVVHISISSIIENHPIQQDPFFEHFFKDMPKKRRSSASGSGFIISSDGFIVTNHHVIADADKIEVSLFDGTKYTAKVIGKDKLSELALIKIEANNLPFIKWGDSSKIEIGDWVLAIGNPMGLDHTVTAGILSGRGRTVFADTAYGQFLQTDAAINFGNSGGPLFNMDSEVIGINTAIVAGGQNIGFAIPSTLAQNIIEQLRENGKVVRGWFGVGIQDIDNELAESFGLPEGMRGVVVNSISVDSPAEKAGLKQGDVIVEFNGGSLKKVNDLQQYVAETKPGKEVEVKIFRQGKFISKSVTVGIRPSDDVESTNEAKNEFGLQLVEITPENRDALNLKEDHGLLVFSIDQTGIAWEKGIRKGDIILEANSEKISKTDDFIRIIKKAEKTSRPIFLLISRDGAERFIALPIK